MKIKILRKSGLPLKDEDLVSYNTEFAILYDRCEAKATAMFEKSNGSLGRVPRMIGLQRLLRFSERLLMQKYSLSQEVDLPKTAGGWKKLISSLGDCPVMVAKRGDTSGIVLVVMDEGL